MITSLLQDFRYAVRSLAKDRAFALLAIIALGLGIGSATVIFSAIYGVILNTFAFQDADQVTSFGIQNLRNPGTGRRENLSISEFLDYRQLNHAFQDISGEYGGFDSTPVRYTAADGTYKFSADYMSANSFAFFGVKPVAGRLATPEDTRPGATPVFMMSYKLWQQQFNANPKTVGTSFTLDGTSRTLVGIMPEAIGADRRRGFVRAARQLRFDAIFGEPGVGSLGPGSIDVWCRRDLRDYCRAS